MKKIVLFLSILLSFNFCFSQNSTSTKTIEIYNTDSASIWMFYKINLPQAGFKNLYIQLIGVHQGYVFDQRYGNIYRLNFQSNTFADAYHNGFLHNSWSISPYGGIDIGYSYDFNISPMDTNLIIKGGCSPWWEPTDQVTLSYNNGDTILTVFPTAFQPIFIAVAIDPTNDSIMYAGLRSAAGTEDFFKTTNRGINWIITDTITNVVKSRAYVNPFDHNTIFLMNSSLYRSTSGGYDFTLNATGTSNGGNMLFDSTDNSIYLVSPTTSGIRKSTNNGDTWIQVFNKSSNDLEIDPLNQNIFYAGSTEGIYKSTNKGLDWFLYNNTFAPSKNVLGLVKNPDTGDTIYAVTSKSVYKVFGKAVLDTESVKYFPLQVGNFFVYYHESSALPPISPYYTKARITKDTLINNYRYFYCQNFPEIFVNGWVRYDSTTGNLLLRAVGQGCSVYADDKILDSLNSKIGNQITCQISVFYTRTCNDTNNYTIFGQSFKSKYFYDGGLIQGYTRYANNLGIVTFESGEPNITDYTVLKGCVVNGVAYGDTNAYHTISGSVRYNDNNQPVTSGIVRAFKFDRVSGGIIVYDTAVIQSDGSYTLSKVPQDSVDIGVFPNSAPPADYVVTYYPSTTYWEHATVLYPTGNLTDINISAYRMTASTNINSVNGKVMRLSDNPLGNLKDAVLYAKNGNTFVRCAISDVNGVYQLNSLPTGSIKIIANRLGFRSDSTIVNVTASNNLDSINFYLILYVSGINQVSSKVPSEYKLFQNYPNPFNPTTNIKYQITKSKLVVLKIYDILGKEIAVLINEKQEPGVYEVTFDASKLPSGIYFCKLISGDFSDTKRMIILK